MISLLVLKSHAVSHEAAIAAVRSIAVDASHPLPQVEPAAPVMPAPQPARRLQVQELASYVHEHAGEHGLDPAAMLAIASQEGLGGGIGDGGLAYGPWQDHITEFRRAPFTGPVRNNQSVNDWAWSPSGIDYVMRAMVAAGASGLTGYDAIVRIATYYERPAPQNLAREIAGAWAQYNQWKG